MLFQTSMNSVLFLNTKQNILKNAGKQTVDIAIDFHCMEKKYYNPFQHANCDYVTHC